VPEKEDDGLPSPLIVRSEEKLIFRLQIELSLFPEQVSPDLEEVSHEEGIDYRRF